MRTWLFWAAVVLVAYYVHGTRTPENEITNLRSEFETLGAVIGTMVLLIQFLQMEKWPWQ